MTGLDAALHAAHAARDGRQLAALYARAAGTAPTEDAACFFLTQAYIHALETGDPAAGPLHARLVAAGREA